MLHERLVKLLNLTSSTNDGEALNAIRAANNLIVKNGLRWEILLLQDSPPPPARSVDTSGPSIQEMIDQIRERITDDFDETFLNSVERQYKNKGRLSDGQIRGLHNIYDTFVGGE